VSPEGNEPSIAELRRQLERVLGTLEVLTIRLETHYVTKEVFDLANSLRDQALKNVETDVVSMKNNINWFLRLVGGVIVVALLSLIFISNGGKP
jgi:hypothetical protein